MKREIGIFYKDLSWGLKVMKNILALYDEEEIEFYNTFRLRTSSGTNIELCDGNSVEVTYGKRRHMVLIQDGLNRTTIETCIFPQAALGKKEIFIWRNKWFQYEALYPKKRNAIEEAEEWLKNVQL